MGVDGTGWMAKDVTTAAELKLVIDPETTSAEAAGAAIDLFPPLSEPSDGGSVGFMPPPIPRLSAPAETATETGDSPSSA